MGKWEMVRLGDVCEGKSSNIAQKDLDQNEGEYPIYGASGLIKYVDFFKHKSEYIAIVKDGAGIGRTILCPERSSVIGTMQAVLPNSSVNSRYLYYAISEMNLAKYYTGATIPHIYFKDYKNEPLPLPPLLIQCQIADVLDRASALIEKRKAQIEKLDFLVKSQFIEMFGDPVTNPKGWEQRNLGEHLKVIGGYAFKSTGYKEDGIPVLRIGNINTGILTLNDIVYWDYNVSLARYLMFPGDLVMSLTGTVGKDDYANVCILPARYPRYYLNQRNAKLEVQGQLDNYYLLYLFRNTEIKKKLTGISRGIRQANISNSDILSLSVPIPPLELQKPLAKLVHQVEAQKFLLQTSLTKLEQNYKSLMQKCFRGEIF